MDVSCYRRIDDVASFFLIEFVFELHLQQLSESLVPNIACLVVLMFSLAKKLSGQSVVVDVCFCLRHDGLYYLSLVFVIRLNLPSLL